MVSLPPDFELYMPYFDMCWYMLTKGWNVVVPTLWNNFNINNYQQHLNNIRYKADNLRAIGQKTDKKKGGKTGKNLGVIEILTKRFGKLAEGYNDKIMEFHNNILDLMITNVLDYKKLAETTFIC